MAKKRKSRWTRIYWDAKPGQGMRPYVRLVPTFMDTESVGFPHGISVGGGDFNSEEEAAAFADKVDRFMDELAAKCASGAVAEVYAEKQMPAKYRFLWRRCGGTTSRWITKTVAAFSIEGAIEAFQAHMRSRLDLDSSDYQVDHPVLMTDSGRKVETLLSLTEHASPFQVFWRNQQWPVGHFPVSQEPPQSA